MWKETENHHQQAECCVRDHGARQSVNECVRWAAHFKGCCSSRGNIHQGAAGQEDQNVLFPASRKELQRLSKHRHLLLRNLLHLYYPLALYNSSPSNATPSISAITPFSFSIYWQSCSEAPSFCLDQLAALIPQIPHQLAPSLPVQAAQSCYH